MREYFEPIFKRDILKSTDFEQVDEFYWLVKDNFEIESDSESDNSDYFD